MLQIIFLASIFLIVSTLFSMLGMGGGILYVPILLFAGYGMSQAPAIIGLLSGMLGITGGIIKLPIMVLLCGVPMDIAVATSTVMLAVTALSGIVAAFNAWSG